LQHRKLEIKALEYKYTLIIELHSIWWYRWIW